MQKVILTLALGGLLSLPLVAQHDTATTAKIYPFYQRLKLSGSLQSDILLPQADRKIGAEDYKEWALTNTYLDLHLQGKYMEAGTRFEFTKYPLPGFEKDFGGVGFPFFYLKAHYKGLEVTAGDFYEQFGAGFILRTYQERSLGIDNALRGGRIVIGPYKGVRFKALAGQQRRYWHHNKGCIYGADLELNVDEWFPRMRQKEHYLSLGGSVVRRYQPQDEILSLRPTGKKDEFGADIIGAYRLNLPKNVTAYEARVNWSHNGFGLVGVYAQTTHNPSFDNHYTYRRGKAALVSFSYSKPGFSALVQAKRSEDMSFRSDRNAVGTSSFINFLPAFSTQHTYALAALYPYATQYTPGEWAFQAELGFRFKRHTLLGGKYGTHLKVNAAHIRGIETQPLLNTEGKPVDVMGTSGYDTHFFKMGKRTYFQDINVMVEKKLSKRFKLSAMYVRQIYNKAVVEGHGDMIHSHIGIVEGKYTFSPKLTLRGEAQYLHTREDQKDWWFGLLELSVLPNFMFTVSDQFNAHVPEGGVEGAPTHPQHYYNAAITYTHKAHRLQVGYGRNRAGFNCSGGVCRWIPAQKGVQISYNYSF